MFWKFSARAKHGLTSGDLKDRLALVERAVSLALHDKQQAAVDREVGDTIANLVTALEATRAACLQFGSLVILKFEKNGNSEIHVRQLSPAEIKAIQDYPDLHDKPERFFEALKVIIDLPAIDSPPTDTP